MQQPIRYYITKSGEEPTVRSVKVARSASASPERTTLASIHPADHKSSPREREWGGRREGVKRLLRDAIRRRTIDA